MLSGFQGVRYGLTVPKKESKTGPKTGLSVFGDDDSEDERATISKNIERQAQKKLSDQKVRRPLCIRVICQELKSEHLEGSSLSNEINF